MHVHVHMYVRTLTTVEQRTTATTNGSLVFLISRVRQFFSNEWCLNLLVIIMASHAALHFKYIHTFLTFQSHLCLSAVNSNKHSLSLKPHPSINRGMHILKISHLKSPVLGNSEFAKYNACQIFPLYGIQEMDFMNVPLSMVHF